MVLWLMPKAMFMKAALKRGKNMDTEKKNM